MVPEASTELINTPTKLLASLKYLKNSQHGEEPDLFMDAEGDNLSREGTRSVLTIYIRHAEKCLLIDITVLKTQAFEETSADGTSLKGVLEDRDFAKVFFDVRNDSDALFSHHGIKLAGIHDLQLMQLMARPSRSYLYLQGLATCIGYDADLTTEENQAWQMTKSKGKALFGSDYGIFDRRPLPPQLLQYCAGDVILMPRLWQVYKCQLQGFEWNLVLKESRSRVRESHQKEYLPNGWHKKYGPNSWRNGSIVWPQWYEREEDRQNGISISPRDAKKPVMLKITNRFSILEQEAEA